MTISTIVRNIFVLAIIISLFVVASTAAAQTRNDLFVGPYAYGMMGNTEVTKLQRFLIDQGFYSGPVTGNYLDQTTAAVKRFQSAHGIEQTGVFGPQSRAAANAILTGSSDRSASFSLIPITGTVEAGQKQTVRWISSAYQGSEVSINLARKVSSNPDRYQLVRVISERTANDGVATWVPANSDIGYDLVLEVGCVDSKVACRAGNTVGSNLAVIRSTRFANTASAFQAIEAADNR